MIELVAMREHGFSDRATTMVGAYLGTMRTQKQPLSACNMCRACLQSADARMYA